MTRRMQITDLASIAVPEQVVLSPDGQQVVYVLRGVDEGADRNTHALWRVGYDSGEPQQLTHGPADTSPAWAPDGRRLAFLRADNGGEAQLWLLDAGGGEPRQLTRLALGAGTPVWSPDGRKIAFTAWADPAARQGESAEERSRRESAPVVIDRLGYQLDGVGLLRGSRRHLHIADIETGDVRQVTTGNWNAGDPAWSPDGARLAFAANAEKDSDLTLRTAAYIVDALDLRAKPRLAGLEGGTAGPLCWTSDGLSLLVIGQDGLPDGHASLLKLDLETGDVTNLTQSLDRNVMAGGLAYPGARVQLVDDGATALFCVRNLGVTHLYSVSLAGGEPKLVLGGEGRVVSALSVAGSRAVVILADRELYGEVVTLDVASGAEEQRTSHARSLAEVSLFPKEERSFTISDGTTVAAWLVHDPEQTGPRPLLLDVHGGPHNSWNAAADEIHLYQQELVSRGWAVLLVNPRGSDGYGSEFFNGVVARWGEAESADLLEPVDALVAEGLADPARLAIAGYSYGGYMACYLTGRDHRFAAAVAGGVVSDLVSMVGTCDDAHYFSELELGGQFWDSRDAYERMSPLSRVQDVQTPTLILNGTDDKVCPVGQAEQWFTALRERGVPTEMVLYPGGGHSFILTAPPSHRLDFNRRVVEWVERFTGSVAGAAPAPIDSAHWQHRLDDLAKRHGVPGAQLGILKVGADDRSTVTAAATGSLNLATGAPATAQSIFQIGSISKVWTATVAMQLVDEGLIDLDAPVIDVMPELTLRDADVNAKVSLRHLLTHTSGIDGDLFTDTGRGDDVLEKYTALLSELPQNHPLGATWSYCNSGFSLIGRIIEKVTGQTWDEALQERLFTPLGLKRTVTLPEQAVLHAAAVGHDAAPGEPLEPVSTWALPRSLGPAGLITTDIADALEFARLHLTGGLAADGTRLLSEKAAAAMAAHQADLPDKHTLGDSWGLGWIRYAWDGHRVIGHDGSTLGQGAALRVLPEQGLAVTIHANGGNVRDLFEDLFREIFAEVADVAVPAPLAPPVVPADVAIDPHLGIYERESVRMEVLNGDDGPMLRTVVLGPLAELVPDPVDEYKLVAVDDNLFVVLPPESEYWVPVTFYALESGERYVHFGARATPKVR